MLKLFALITITTACLLQPLPTAAQQLSPDDLVKRVTAEMLQTIQTDKQLQAGDRRKALALAEEKILPLIDFEEATRLATGRAWRNATPEQRAQLVQEFRRLLVRVYSSALGIYKGQTMQVQPVRMAPDATEATVRNRCISPGKPPVAIDYAMRKTADGWKIYDIVAEGISLVLTYRGGFEDIVRQSGVDGLIKQISDKNGPP